MAAIVDTAKINKSHNKSFQLAIVLFLDQKFKIYMGGGGSNFLKGGDIPRIFAPLLRGGRISWGGGENPVTPVSYGFYVVYVALWTLLRVELMCFSLCNNSKTPKFGPREFIQNSGNINKDKLKV